MASWSKEDMKQVAKLHGKGDCFAFTGHACLVKLDRGDFVPNAIDGLIFSWWWWIKKKEHSFCSKGYVLIIRSIVKVYV